jgi:hypothetical protein
MVEDMDAKKVLSAQVIEEAKHVTAYQKYLGLLGLIPEIDPNSRCVLDDVLRTNSIALKMVGLHLLTETVAYYSFKTVYMGISHNSFYFKAKKEWKTRRYSSYCGFFIVGLLSDLSSYITGQVIGVSDGLTMV